MTVCFVDELSLNRVRLQDQLSPEKKLQVWPVPCCGILLVVIRYILMYKPTICGWILIIKLWRSAYMRVMPHSHTLTVRVSMIWTMSWPLSLHVCMGACAVGGGTTHTAVAAAAYSHYNLTPLQYSHRARPSFSQSHTRAVSWHSCIINAQI